MDLRKYIKAQTLIHGHELGPMLDEDLAQQVYVALGKIRAAYDEQVERDEQEVEE